MRFDSILDFNFIDSENNLTSIHRIYLKNKSERAPNWSKIIANIKNHLNLNMKGKNVRN